MVIVVAKSHDNIVAAYGPFDSVEKARTWIVENMVETDFHLELVELYDVAFFNVTP